MRKTHPWTNKKDVANGNKKEYKPKADGLATRDA